MTVIDFRFRPPTEEWKASMKGLNEITRSDTGGRVPPWSRVLDSWWESTLEDCVKEMKQADLIGVVLGRGGPPSLAVSNDHIKDVANQYPERFIPFAGIDPTKRRACQDEISRIATLGFKGVHFDPGFLESPMLPQDARLYPIYAQCDDLKLIVVLQIGPRAGYDVEAMSVSPKGIDRVARDFPTLQIVIAHACWPFIDEMVAVMWKRPNVWLSPDNYQLRPLGLRYVEIVNYDSPIQDRYLYGSAYPFGRGVKAQLDEWKSLPWKEAIVEKLLYSNAARLLGITH